MSALTPVEFQFWKALLDSVQNDNLFLDRGRDLWQSMGSPMLSGGCLALLIGLCITALLAASYHPRIPRGALWMPAFGLFGGTATLYNHTRPSTLFGIWHNTHRRIRSSHKSRRHKGSASAKIR